LTGTVAPLTIVMYHYVRDLPRTRYPKIKGLLTERFVGQLNYLQKHHSIVSVDQVMSAYLDGDELPTRPCLLTFDDGFIDHYVTVFPILAERSLSAGFFPPAQPILERKVVEAHKLHLILATVPDPEDLPLQIFKLLLPYRKECFLPGDEELYRRYAIPDPYDTPNVRFVKVMLNKVLPPHIGTDICDQLFGAIVSEDEAAIAQECYMDLPQLRCMVRNGMHIGGHGYRHHRLSTLNESEQRREIQGTVDFLSSVYDQVPARWVMSYPYGDRNETTVKLLGETTCSLSLLSIPDLVEQTPSLPAEMPRLDTNDLPWDANTEPNEWTRRVLQSSETSRVNR